MQGWRYQLEEDFSKKCQRWVVTRDPAWRCEHDACNIAVFERTLLSILHSQSRKNHLFGRKNRMVQPDSLNVGYSGREGREQRQNGVALACVRLGRSALMPGTTTAILRWHGPSLLLAFAIWNDGKQPMVTELDKSVTNPLLHQSPLQCIGGRCQDRWPGPSPLLYGPVCLVPLQG